MAARCSGVTARFAYPLSHAGRGRYPFEAAHYERFPVGWFARTRDAAAFSIPDSRFPIPDSRRYAPGSKYMICKAFQALA